jgi:hypothetical protein
VPQPWKPRFEPVDHDVASSGAHDAHRGGKPSRSTAEEDCDHGEAIEEGDERKAEVIEEAFRWPGRTGG